MNNEYQTMLAEVRTMLADATSLNDNGQHGAALEKTYHASEYVAAAYLLDATGKKLQANNATFDLFARMIREPNRHPEQLQEIRGVVGDVCALREIYEPALLDETTNQDAKQVIGCMTALAGLLEKVICGR